MSEEEDFDEFPSIEVNSSLPKPEPFVMPSAAEVAEERAREEAELVKERAREEAELAEERAREEAELAEERAREEAEPALAAAAGLSPGGPEGGAALAAAAGDSSGGPEGGAALTAAAGDSSSGPEGGAALAAAAGDSSGDPEGGAAQAAAAGDSSSGSKGGAAVMDALRAALPPRAGPEEDDALFLRNYMIAARDRPDAHFAGLTRELLGDVTEMAYDESTAWDEGMYVEVCVWVCALAAGGPGARSVRGVAVRRVLHALVDDVGSEALVEALRGVLRRAARALHARAAVQLCDALQSGSERGARLGSDLAARALAALASLPDDREVTMEEVGRALVAQGRWRRMAPAQRHHVLQLLPRARLEGARELLAALQALPVQRGRSRRPDALQVLSAANKLSVLLHKPGK